MEEELARSIYYNPDTYTLDIWLGDQSSEVHAEPVTENLVGKYNEQGDVIGFEVIQLSKLTNEDMKRMPEEVKDLHKQKRDSVIHRSSSSQMSDRRATVKRSQRTIKLDSLSIFRVLASHFIEIVNRS